MNLEHMVASSAVWSPLSMRLLEEFEKKIMKLEHVKNGLCDENVLRLPNLNELINILVKDKVDKLCEN